MQNALPHNPGARLFTPNLVGIQFFRSCAASSGHINGTVWSQKHGSVVQLCSIFFVGWSISSRSSLKCSLQCTNAAQGILSILWMGHSVLLTFLSACYVLWAKHLYVLVLVMLMQGYNSCANHATLIQFPIFAPSCAKIVKFASKGPTSLKTSAVAQTSARNWGDIGRL